MNTDQSCYIETRRLNLLKVAPAEMVARIMQLERAITELRHSINRMPRTKQAEDMQAECGMLSAMANARAALNPNAKG
jgi:hypothetical protein